MEICMTLKSVYKASRESQLKFTLWESTGWEAAKKAHDLAVQFNDRFDSHVLSARSMAIGTDNINHALRVKKDKYVVDVFKLFFG